MVSGVAIRIGGAKYYHHAGAPPWAKQLCGSTTLNLLNLGVSRGSQMIFYVFADGPKEAAVSLQNQKWGSKDSSR